jgi:hypothetical protein
MKDEETQSVSTPSPSVNYLAAVQRLICHNWSHGAVVTPVTFDWTHASTTSPGTVL